MEAIAQWVTQYGEQCVTQYGYAAIFVIQALSIFGVPFPDESTLVFFGYLVFKLNLNPVFAIASAAAGSMCGISISYGLGRSMGFFALRKLVRFFRVSPEALEKTHAQYNRFGPWLLFFGYFIPGVRHINAAVSGSLQLGFRRFALYAWTGAVVWVSVFVGIGYLLGEQWALLFKQIESRLMTIILIALAAALVVLLIRFFKNSERKK